MTAPQPCRDLVGDESLDVVLQPIGAAPQALQLALQQLGVLELLAVHLARQALRRALGKAQQLDHVVCRAERAAAGLGIHARSIAGVI